MKENLHNGTLGCAYPDPRNGREVYVFNYWHKFIQIYLDTENLGGPMFSTTDALWQ